MNVSELKVRKMMDVKINFELQKYIEKNILPEYVLNDEGHNSGHVSRVLQRAYELAENYDINYDMLYVVVCYHDVACHIDREKHELLSAERLYNDNYLRDYFNEDQMLVMKQAVEDHRASLEYEPRNIYGKILSSADRKVDLFDYMRTSMFFHKKKFPDASDDEMIAHSYEHAIKKFGKNGYAVTKFYIPDKKYQAFLDELQSLIENRDEYEKRAKQVLKQVREGKNNG